ncbi:MAG: GNAT family N-acetyltransferase [Burkholderiales bacterium]
MITFSSNTSDVDWDALKADLIRDGFHNGRTTAQLRKSFENSSHVALAFDDGHCIANGRMLSDGVGNALVVDVWTHSKYRRQGIATRIMEMLVAAAPGQHIYLQSDDAVEFYSKLGFRRQPEGLSIISGKYLANGTRES